ncbi:MAG: hypothetical protein Q4D84_07370, partial [Campylobacter sp.]|nr:hypothetical protein [Campylobacter sp.]
MNGNNNTITWNATPATLTEDIGIVAGYIYITDVSGNTLNFNGNTTNFIKGLYGGYTNKIARGNTLNITGGNASGYVVGGEGMKGSVNNTLKISGGNFT